MTLIIIPGFVLELSELEIMEKLLACLYWSL